MKQKIMIWNPDKLERNEDALRAGPEYLNIWIYVSLILPNLQFPDLKVESELFMALSMVIITIIVILSLVKTILARVLSKGFIK